MLLENEDIPYTMNRELTIDADFPGGNIIVEKIENNNICLYQDLRDTPSWFYWAFRVQGAQGKTVTFHFTGGDVLGTQSPAASYDILKSSTWTT